MKRISLPKGKRMGLMAVCLAAVLVMSALLSGCGKVEGPVGDDSSAKGDAAHSESGDAVSGAASDKAPEKEHYGAIIEDGCLRYRLVNKSFYEVYSLSEDLMHGVAEDVPKTLTIPATLNRKPVKRIRGEATAEDIVNGMDDFLLTMSGGALGQCKHFVSINIEEGIEEIGARAFYDNSMLQLSIPASVTVIGEDAFGGCDALASIQVAEGNPVFRVENGALFDGSTGKLLKYPARAGGGEFSFPEGTKQIGINAFEGCTALEALAVPEGVESIGESAFRGCTALEKISLPSSFREIKSYYGFGGATLFGGNWKLREIDVAKGNQNFKSVDGVFFSGDGKELLFYPVCREGSEYTVPEGVKVISHTAFDDDRYTSTAREEELPTAGIVRLTLPASLDEDTLLGLPERFLEEIVVEKGNKVFKAVDGVLYSADGKTVYHYPQCKSAEEFIIPEGVTEMKYYFRRPESSALRRVSIPASLDGKNTWYTMLDRLPLLEEITVAENNPDLRTVDGALYDAGMETLLIYPQGRPDESFTVPEGVKAIKGGCGIAENTHLKNLHLPASLENVQEIEEGDAVSSPLPRSIVSVTVAEGNVRYKALDGMLFDAEKDWLLFYPPAKPEQTVTLPEGTRSICERAIENPLYLKNLILPDSLATVYGGAVRSEVLESIYLGGGLSVVQSSGLRLPEGCKVSSRMKYKPFGYQNNWLILGEGPATEEQVTWAVIR